MEAGAPPGPSRLMLAPCSCLCRDWYINGNYLVILVSVTVILPLALMRQLGGCGKARALEGDVGGVPGRGPQSHSPSPLCRLPGLLQRLLSQLHGVLPNRGESPSTLEGRAGLGGGLLCQAEGAGLYGKPGSEGISFRPDLEVASS